MAQELDAREEISPSEVRAALLQVTASPTFVKSMQLSNFLRYVVEETLAGRGGRLKAYNVATGALGRDENFDPLVDPIVRVEAGRLRRALENYYADEGRHDHVMIKLPVGSYTPVFRPDGRPPQTNFGLRETWRQIIQIVQENKRLVGLMVGIAAALSLLFDLVEMLLFKVG